MIPSFFPYLQSTKMAKKPSKAGQIQTAKTKKIIQEALSDADTTQHDNDEGSTPIDKEPKQGEPKDLQFTKEIKPDSLDAITVMEPQNDKTSPDVASTVAIGDNYPFAIAIAANQNENPCTSDGEETTVPTPENVDDGLSNVVVPRKKTVRPMEPEPQAPKQTTRT
jgi:hypothetical protein